MSSIRAAPGSHAVFVAHNGRNEITLGAEGVLPSRQIESFLRVFKQFTHNLPSRHVVAIYQFAHHFDLN